MTNKEAVKILRDVRKYFSGGKLTTADNDDICDALTFAIEALKATQWIPCSERLPKKNGEYLVTVREDSRFAFNGERTVYQETFQSLCQWYDCGNDVIAWMEIPEPYTEVNNGN